MRTSCLAGRHRTLLCCLYSYPTFSHLRTKHHWQPRCVIESCRLTNKFFSLAAEKRRNHNVHKSQQQGHCDSQDDKKASLTIVFLRISFCTDDLPDPSTRADHWRS